MLYRATPESPRLFENDLADSLTRVPAWIVPVVYVPTILGFLAVGAWNGETPGALVAQFALGWFVWTLMEYWLHRTLFHWVPNTSWGPTFHFALHGVHHEWHRDKLRLVMPPAVSGALGAIFLGLTFGVAELASPWVAATWVWAYFAGKMMGYLVYDLGHYAMHHFKPRTQMGRWLRAHHMAHHHNPRFQHRKFGVSTTIWDHVFGTYSA